MIFINITTYTFGWFWVSHWMDKLRSQLLLFIWTKIGLVIFSRILFESWWTSCRVFLSWGRKPLGCIPKSRCTGLVWQMLIWKEPGDGRKMIKCLLRQTGIHQSQMVEDPRTIMKWFTGFAGMTTIVRLTLPLVLDQYMPYV